jgi:hypothetical protein
MSSTLSIPLVVSGDGLGALNICCHREYGFPAADDRLAAHLGSCASVALVTRASTSARPGWLTSYSKPYTPAESSSRRRASSSPSAAAPRSMPSTC